MADCLFARYQLEKQGWTEGAGLGKNEDGITKAIKVDLKNNKDGVGHLPGSELTNNWWDQVYNKAASHISVKTTKDGVAVHVAETKESNKNKSLLYSRFVKGATLKSSEGITVEESVESSESDSEKEQIPPRLTDEEMLKICGGRTAHKAAGHGMKLNGKLLRIQEQERQYLESLNKRADSVSNFSISEPKRGNKRVAEEEEEHVISKEEMSFQKEEFHGKKRKKELKEGAIQVEDSTELVEPTKKKKKKKKKCKDEREQNKKEEEEDEKDQVIENEKIKSNKKKQKKKCEMQEEKLESVDIEKIVYSEKKRKYLEETAKESPEARDVEINEKKNQYEIQEYGETKQEFGELTNKKKKKHRVNKEQLEEVESNGKKKKKRRHQEEEIEYREENQSENEAEQDGRCLREERKKKKKKKKKRETEKSLIENEESSVQELQKKVEEEGLEGKSEGEINENADEQESMKVDNCQKKVRFSSELVTVFTFSDEEEETNAETQKKKEKKIKHLIKPHLKYSLNIDYT